MITKPDRKKILFLPADSVPLGVSRSYWLAKFLAVHHEVYLLQWSDPRTWIWSTEGRRHGSTFRAFTGSLLQPFQCQRLDGENGLRVVRTPVMLDAGICRLLGRLPARRLARRFNRRSLARLIRRVKPDVLFYADGFYYFPALQANGVRIFADVQDDFEDTEEDLLKGEVAYSSACFQRCDKAFAVSPAACERLSKLYSGVPFEWLPNGAEFQSYREVPLAVVAETKARLGLDRSFVISFIGGDVWFDQNFLKSLAGQLAQTIPHAKLLLVGKLPVVSAPNIVSAGFVVPQDIVKYFLLSDLGVHLKDAADSNFLYNSIPLKIIQYAAARKPFLSPRIGWLEKEQFPNVRMLPMRVDAWVEAIHEAQHFQWTSACDRAWENYDWANVGAALARKLAGSGNSR